MRAKSVVWHHLGAALRKTTRNQGLGAIAMEIGANHEPNANQDCKNDQSQKRYR